MKKSELKELIKECIDEILLEKQWSDSYRFKDVIRALRKIGYNLQRQEGSHATFYNPNAQEPPYKKSVTIVNRRGTDSLDRGAIVQICKETGLDPTRI